MTIFQSNFFTHVNTTKNWRKKSIFICESWFAIMKTFRFFFYYYFVYLFLFSKSLCFGIIFVLCCLFIFFAHIPVNRGNLMNWSRHTITHAYERSRHKWSNDEFSDLFLCVEMIYINVNEWRRWWPCWFMFWFLNFFFKQTRNKIATKMK